MTKRMKPSFEAAFPNITRWVKDCGTVEIGYDPHTDSFIRAIQEGGLVWSGESQYKSLDDAFQDLGTGITTTLHSHIPGHKPAAKRKLSAKPPRTTKTPDEPQRRPQISTLPKQVHKLDEIVESIRRQENVQVTRLTVVKKLCENPEAAQAFALFLARKAQERLREKQGNERYRELVNRAIREMKPYLDNPTEDRKWRLLALLREIEEEQNEHKSISWGMVRNIKSWDLLIVEQALRSIIRTDEAPYWLYQAARDHVGSSDFLTAKFIPRIEGIARFWRRYFKVKA